MWVTDDNSCFHICVFLLILNYEPPRHNSLAGLTTLPFLGWRKGSLPPGKEPQVAESLGQDRRDVCPFWWFTDPSTPQNYQESFMTHVLRLCMGNIDWVLISGIGPSDPYAHQAHWMSIRDPAQFLEISLHGAVACQQDSPGMLCCAMLSGWNFGGVPKPLESLPLLSWVWRRNCEHRQTSCFSFSASWVI